VDALRKLLWLSLRLFKLVDTSGGSLRTSKRGRRLGFRGKGVEGVLRGSEGCLKAGIRIYRLDIT